MFLLARDGYAATSSGGPRALRGAPRGSVYYHFPGGKDELIEAAIRLTLDNFVESLERLRGKHPSVIIDAFSSGWRGILERNDCRNGCPIMAVSSGAADNEKLQSEVQRAFAGWQGVLAELFVEGGVEEGATGAPRRLPPRLLRRRGPARPSGAVHPAFRLRRRRSSVPLHISSPAPHLVTDSHPAPRSTTRTAGGVSDPNF